ncbi:hypothetical protein PHLCEN_2v9227 [Hermanssonia centrifuga]|uniref:DUF6533 domain-containing protein n=1 Tax=Hermanssonia centrifuga TaxID=98765 RepID=A0A2R6NRE7_9APHY|nr:hypothetical protein PHLCEN_2v9227 [Hermanssonia centrifuga]
MPEKQLHSLRTLLDGVATSANPPSLQSCLKPHLTPLRLSLNFMTTLAAYEYIITFNQEVTMIWRRKWSIVTWIFMANRYLMMSSAIWDSTPPTAEWVRKFIKVSKSLNSCFPTRVEPILISRFLLNLRQVGVEVDPVNSTQDASTSRFSGPGFRVPTLESILMVGNMGEDLDHGPAELEDTETTDVDEGVDPLDSYTEVPSGESI